MWKGTHIGCHYETGSGDQFCWNLWQCCQCPSVSLLSSEPIWSSSFLQGSQDFVMTRCLSIWCFSRKEITTKEFNFVNIVTMSENLDHYSTKLSQPQEKYICDTVRFSKAQAWFQFWNLKSHLCSITYIMLLGHNQKPAVGYINLVFKENTCNGF